VDSFEYDTESSPSWKQFEDTSASSHQKSRRLIFEVFAMARRKTIFWDVMPCSAVVLCQY